MTQGTKSILFGCHSVVHSLLVVMAWRRLYGSWPKAWQIVCIFLHDIGHFGLNYLDNYEQKKIHWVGGAKIASYLFGLKGFLLCAGHCVHSGVPRSRMYKADKYSWLLAPRWWLLTNTFVEPQLRNGFDSRGDAVDTFREAVRKNIESGTYQETHQFYLQRSKI